MIPSKISHNVNREVVLMGNDLLIYARLSAVFECDWALVTR
jgi:hypothetical protein